MKPSANSPGMLIALEGIDGAGKSTQASKLAEWLRGSGRGTLVLHEPTRGPHGMRLRALMEAGRDGVTPHQEFTLFLDDRAQNVRENIRPALARGEIVLMDRYYISSMGYQGARGLDPAEIRKANEAFAPVPDLIIMFDLPVAVALDRIRKRHGDGPNLFEREEHLLRAQAIFDGLSGFPRVHRIDATRDETSMLNELKALLSTLLSG